MVASGAPGEVFEPRHTTHGFQYVAVAGPGRRPDTGGRRGLHGRAHRPGTPGDSSTAATTGSTAARHRGVELPRQRLRSSPPTARTRERAGWTGDWQIYVEPPPSCTTSPRLLRQVAARPRRRPVARRPSPEHRSRRTPAPAASRRTDLIEGSGWGDAAVFVPWEIYAPPVTSESWNGSTSRWPAGSTTPPARRRPRHPDRAPAPPTGPPRAVPLGHRLPLRRVARARRAPRGPIFAALGRRQRPRRHGLPAPSAAELPRSPVSWAGRGGARFAELARRHAHAWRIEVPRPTARSRPTTQANLVRALAFGLVPDELRRRWSTDWWRSSATPGRTSAPASWRRPSCCRCSPTTATWTSPTSCCCRPEVPGWRSWWTAGPPPCGRTGTASSTTVTAHVAQPLLQGCGDQLPAPLHRRPPPDAARLPPLRVRPRPGGGITSAAAHHDRPHGRIESRWHLDAGALSIDVRVPPGASATLVLPDGTTEELAPGHHQRSGAVS